MKISNILITKIMLKITIFNLIYTFNRLRKTVDIKILEINIMNFGIF